MGFSAPTHLVDADDVLIFCIGTMKNLRGIMHTFEFYCALSGQIINGRTLYPAALETYRGQVTSSIWSSLRAYFSNLLLTYWSFMKGCFAAPLGSVFAFEAELLDMSMAINYAWNNEWRRIWIKSDSSYVV
ncbi:hypothetical protein Dsin_024878 [Dipteronia sinensis]|uniref:RNase H type-1 domain-containing protein n=1 Tax=Dipteronia sinensis TaxID=43782 RepID=A0AAD9ZW72_9ROSI|nr:hypothetical protein Dsin_024878 [Dipteronia sinensis]